MKRLAICLTAVTVLSSIGPHAMAQRQRGNHTTVVPPGLHGTAGLGSDRQGMGRGSRATSQSTGATLPADGGQSLLRMWEEEKLARDVYLALAKNMQLPVFQNIASSENRHMQALEKVLQLSGVNTQQLDKTPGVFVLPEHQQLYQSLVIAGSSDPLSAFKVGAKIEEMDIADLRTLMYQTENSQLQRVLQNLMGGSEQHLRAFAAHITQQGATYDAEFISQADFDQIAAGKSSGQQSGQGKNAGSSASQGKSAGQSSGGNQVGGSGFTAPGRQLGRQRNQR